MERRISAPSSSSEREESCLLPGSHFDCFEDFGEWYSCPLVNRSDVGERVGAEDTDGLSLAGQEKTSEKAHDPASSTDLVGHFAGCLLSGCVLISSQAWNLPENEEGRHVQLLRGP